MSGEVVFVLGYEVGCFAGLDFDTRHDRSNFVDNGHNQRTTYTYVHPLPHTLKLAG